MGVSGDFAKLSELAHMAEAVAGMGGKAERFRTGLLTSCAEAARGALDDSFMSGIDPYGKPWAPLKERAGKPLSDTGRLASSWTYALTSGGFKIATNVAYAATHQYGAVIRPVVAKRLAWKPRGGKWTFAMKVTIPKRQMVPEGSDIGLWKKAIDKEGEAFVAQWFAK